MWRSSGKRRSVCWSYVVLCIGPRMAKTGANAGDKPQGLSLTYKQHLTWRQRSDMSSEPQALAAEPQADFGTEAPVLHHFHEVRRGSIRAPNHPHGRISVCGLLLDYCDMYVLFDGGRPGLKQKEAVAEQICEPTAFNQRRGNLLERVCKRSTA